MGEQETSLSDLPAHVMIDILSRLPLRSAITCSLVCRNWLSMVYDQQFANGYSVNAPTLMLLPISTKIYGPDETAQVKMFDVEECRDYYVPLGSIHHQLDSNLPNLQLGNWCRGLVCLCDCASGDPVSVWNPLTGQSVSLPRVTRKAINGGKGASGLGFCLRTQKFMVILVEPYGLEAEITVVGGDNWTSVGRAPCSFSQQKTGTFLNGTVHWIIEGHDSQLICRFDLETDRKFSYLPPPPAFSSEAIGRLYHWTNLAVLDDKLHICACNKIELNPDIQVWVMKDYGVKESWSKVMSMKFPIVEWWNPYRSLQLIKTDVEKEEVLLFCGNEELLSYNCRKREFKNLLKLKIDAVAHIPSFNSPINAAI